MTKAVWLLLSLLAGALVAIGLAFGALQTFEPMYRRSALGGLLSGAILVAGAWIPTWLVGRLHPRLTRAHLLAYFAVLLTLFFVIAILNMQAEL